jgi:hypothetical protein
MDYPYYLTAMDPGGTTGLTLNRISDEDFVLVDSAAVPYRKDTTGPVGKMKEWVEEHSDHPHILVYEDFHVRPVRGPVDTTAINVISEVKSWLAEGDQNQELAEIHGLLQGLKQFVQIGGQSVYTAIMERMATLYDSEVTGPYRMVLRQTPTEGKRMVPDDALKRAGMWLSGPDAQHMRDAQRHAATYLAKRKYMPLCRIAWPRD